MEKGFLRMRFFKLGTTFPIPACHSYCEFDVFVNYFLVVDNPLWQALQNVLFREQMNMNMLKIQVTQTNISLVKKYVFYDIIFEN